MTQAKRGDVRVVGGPEVKDIRAEVFDGAAWFPLRCVQSIAWEAGAIGRPSARLHISGVFTCADPRSDEAAEAPT